MSEVPSGSVNERLVYEVVDVLMEFQRETVAALRNPSTDLRGGTFGEWAERIINLVQQSGDREADRG